MLQYNEFGHLRDFLQCPAAFRRNLSVVSLTCSDGKASTSAVQMTAGAKAFTVMPVSTSSLPALSPSRSPSSPWKSSKPPCPRCPPCRRWTPRAGRDLSCAAACADHRLRGGEGAAHVENPVKVGQFHLVVSFSRLSGYARAFHLNVDAAELQCDGIDGTPNGNGIRVSRFARENPRPSAAPVITAVWSIVCFINNFAFTHKYKNETSR